MINEVLVGLGVFLTALAGFLGALVAVSKRKPETAQVLVKSASELVISHGTVLRDTTEAYQAVHAANEDLQKRMIELEKKIEAQEALQRVAAAEVEDLHRELASMHEVVAQLTRARDQAGEELEIEKHERRRLQTRVALLEETLRNHNIPVPNGDRQEEESADGDS